MVPKGNGQLLFKPFLALGGVLKNTMFFVVDRLIEGLRCADFSVVPFCRQGEPHLRVFLFEPFGGKLLKKRWPQAKPPVGEGHLSEV